MVYIDDHVDALDLDLALTRVSAQRREQALKFRHDNGRRLSLAVYLLLVGGLRDEFGIEESPVFDYTAGGKPFIPGHPDIHFSFSHSGNVALCALSGQPVGADVEVPRKISSPLIAYTMNDREQEQINASADPALRFLYFWTRKEALLKLTGEGIRNDMKNVLSEAERYHFETIKTNNFLFSIVKHRE